MRGVFFEGDRPRVWMRMKVPAFGATGLALAACIAATLPASAQQQALLPSVKLFAKPKDLKTTDCFEKYLWKKWFQFFAEGKVGKDIVDIPDDPLLAGVKGADPIWETYTWTADGTDIWQLKDGTTVERRKDGSVIEKRNGKVAQICPPRTTAAIAPPKESPPPPGQTQPPKTEGCRSPEDEAAIARLKVEVASARAEFEQIEAKQKEADKIEDELYKRRLKLSSYDQGEPRDPGDENLVLEAEIIDVEAKLEAARAILYPLNEQYWAAWTRWNRLDDILYDLEHKKPCPDKSVGSRIPSPSFIPHVYDTAMVTFATDSTELCTYGEGIGSPTFITLEQVGSPVAALPASEPGPVSENPPSERAPKESPAITTRSPREQPPLTPPDTPKVMAKLPAAGPSTPAENANVLDQPPTPEMPKRAETPPEQPSDSPKLTETPSERPPNAAIPDTIFVKARQSVLEDQSAAHPLQKQVVKLFTDKPDLPGTGTKAAQDSGFDKDPVQCTTGAEGECRMHVPAGSRPLYGLPGADQQPGRNYRLEYDVPKRSGVVVETTGMRTKPDASIGTPAGAQVTAEDFKIGERTFVRLGYKLPYGVEHDFQQQYKPIFGPKFSEDFCREKQPGPPPMPLSMSSLNREIPAARVTIHSQMRHRRSVQ